MYGDLRWSRIGCALLALWGGAAGIGEPAPWADEAAGDAARAVAESLFERGSRIPGSPANLALEARVAERFAQSGFAHGALSFAAPAFHPGEASLGLPGGRTVPLHPLHPSVIRPGNFAERRFAARLVDLRDGSTEALEGVRGVALRDALVLLDFHCGRSWERLLRFGVKGFLFVGADAFGRQDAFDKVPTSEVAVPRFLVSAEDGAQLRAAMGTGREVPVELASEPSRWTRCELRNPWVLVPGADPVLSNEVVVLVAPLDASGVAPGLAEGGEAAGNLVALLGLLDRFRGTPPARSVLLAAVNARTHNYLGDRILAWYLLSPQNAIEEVRGELSRDIRLQERVLHFMDRLQFTPESRAADEQFLIDLRTLSDNEIGRQITLKAPLVSLCQRDVNAIKTEQLMLLREENAARERLTAAGTEDAPETKRALEEVSARRAALDVRLQEQVQVLTLFNRVGVQTQLSDLTVKEESILRGYVATVVERNREGARLNRLDLERSERNSAVRTALGGRAPALVLSLEQSWVRPDIGFSSGISLGAAPWADRFGRNTTRMAAELDPVAAGRHPNLLVNAMTQVGGLHERFYVPDITQAVLCYQLANRIPALSVNTAYAETSRAFTPADRLDVVDWRLVAGSTRFLGDLLTGLLADPTVLSSTELPPPPVRSDRLWSVRLKAFAFDEFSAGVEPEIPVPGTVITLTPKFGPGVMPDGLTGNGICASYVEVTDARAASVCYGVREAFLSSSAYQFDADFTSVLHALDAGEAHAKINTDLQVSTSRILSMVPCREFVLWNRAEVPFLSSKPIDVLYYYPLSAVRNAVPRRYGIGGASSDYSGKFMPPDLWGPVGLYLQEGERLKAVTRYKSVVLHATDAAPEGVGFASDKELGSDFFRQAMLDMGTLNRSRFAEFRDVADVLTADLLRRAEDSAATMRQAEEARDHVGTLQALHDGFGAQTKAYVQITTTTNDMLKAVVFYMALLLPFCFFIQKLLFKTVRIEAQLGLFAVLFVLCYLAFRLLHPAFRIAQAPEAMFIAFVMGTLGMFVIWILHGRFEGEMKLLFSSLASGGEAQGAGYGMVSQQALLIGVNNMKRRRIRTALTTATIVLVTFTMLAFTSVSRRMSPTVIAQDREPAYTGLIVHWPGGLCMDESSHTALRELFAGRGDVLTRRWLLPPKSGGGTAILRAETMEGRSVLIDGVLGLEPAEAGLLGPWPAVAGGYFSGADADEVILARSLAGLLGIGGEDVGRAVLRFGGRELRLAGIVDEHRLRDLRDLNGLSILPVKQMARTQGAGDVTASVDADTLADESSVFYVEPASLLILPVETARRMRAKPYSVSVRLAADEPLWPFVERLLMATQARFFLGSRTPFTLSDAEDSRRNEPGVFYVGAGYRTSIGGLAMLLIPLLIASTIILNTMLGSVFERKKEIAVFNAVGLNPTHIGLFFLAESFVYGIIGAVGGYMIGQGLSLLLNRFGWIEDINLNFSSLSVAYVIVFTLAVVLLSTLYPAVVATRAAVPSGKRKWSMPPHDGERMELVFPFIYPSAEVALGVLHYLDEFFAQFTEASTGDLIARRAGCATDRDATGRPVHRLSYELALAPFDLGVTQASVFEAAYAAHVGAYRVTMRTTRRSGQDANWVTTNKPYLEQLRKLLLNWRNLKPAEHGEHAGRGAALFATEEHHGHEA